MVSHRYRSKNNSNKPLEITVGNYMQRHVGILEYSIENTNTYGIKLKNKFVYIFYSLNIYKHYYFHKK